MWLNLLKFATANGAATQGVLTRPLAALIFALVLSPAIFARQWHDESGRFKVEAEMVSANNELVVLRTAKGRLLAIELAELSQEDREFVAASLKTDTSPSLRSPGEVDPLAPEPANAESPPRRSAEERRQWKLVDNTTIQGDFFGFDFEPLVISRRLGKVMVGNTAAGDLNPLYRTIIPLAMGHLEGAKITDVRELEDWLRKSGPGPWRYPLESVVIETPEHGRVSVPMFLLDPPARESLEDAYQRWKLAYASEAPEEEKDRYMDRERFLTRAEMNQLAASEAIRQQVQLLRLEQLAAATDVTEVWEVVLVPPGFGYPVSVVIVAPNSAAAQQVARSQYPAFRLAGIQKASW